MLRGVDEDVFRVRSLDDRPVDQTIEVVIGEAQLDIRAVSETEIRIGPLTIGGHGSAELEVEVPRGRTVLAQTASGDIQASGLTGETRFATASGDITVDEISGRVRFESMSGDVGIHASDAVDVDARTVSGELTLRAPRFRSLPPGLDERRSRRPGRARSRRPRHPDDQRRHRPHHPDRDAPRDVDGHG